VSWPVVFAAGGPRERGRAYGSRAADRVHRSIEIYERVFAHYARLPWAEVRRRAAPFVDAIDAYDVQLLPELEGIAEGAGVEAEDILAVNLRTEIMFGLDARPAQAAAKSPPKECTAIGRRLDDGRVWIAQTWDWKPAMRDTCVVLVCAPHDRPGFVTVVEAGLWAKCGANEAGIGLSTNALQSSLDVGAPGVPFHAILRRVLTSATFDEALDAVTCGPRASSANYLVGHRDGRMVDLETAPGGPNDLFAQQGPAVVHANHFVWPMPPFRDLGLIDGEDSLHRHAIAAGAATTIETLEALRSTLGSHEDPAGPICVHGDTSLDPVEDYVTITAMLADLTEGTLAWTDGNPCRAAFEEHRIDELVSRARTTGLHREPETLAPGHPPG
jgi:isopenicillin-N N-acyltransferase-like protein